MLTTQSGIFALGTGSHAYLEFALHPGVAPIRLARAIGDALPPHGPARVGCPNGR